MFGAGRIRSGIDLGTTSVKLVRGEGKVRLERISHVGLQAIDPQAAQKDEGRTAQALLTMLRQLGLGKSSLGRIAVAIPATQASIREVLLPPLTEEELRRALPFEARKHLNIEGMEDPVVDCQILGRAPPVEEGGPEQTRVLLAAAPQEWRDFPVNVLGRLGLEPEVVDLQPLAALNELLVRLPVTSEVDGKAVALLDLGASLVTLHITSRQGGFLSRSVGVGRIAASSEPIATYASKLADSVGQTLTYYRGRYRLEIAHFYMSGGGALDAHLREALVQALQQSITVLDPLAELPESVRTSPGVTECGAQFVTACGLCRWWDRADV